MSLDPRLRAPLAGLLVVGTILFGAPRPLVVPLLALLLVLVLTVLVLARPGRWS